MLVILPLYRSLGPMNHRLFSALTLCCATFAAADTPPQQLTITVATPKVAIVPQIAGRGFIPLPELEYRFLLEPRCAPGWQARSITLSIADSRQVLNGEILDEHGFARAALTVPAAQLAPLPVSGFCEETASGHDNAVASQVRRELRISAALSVHAALICVSEDAERILYLTRPLAVTLQCQASGQSEAE